MAIPTGFICINPAIPLILVVGALYYFLVQKPMAKRAQQQDKNAA